MVCALLSSSRCAVLGTLVWTTHILITLGDHTGYHIPVPTLNIYQARSNDNDTYNNASQILPAVGKSELVSPLAWLSRPFRLFRPFPVLPFHRFAISALCLFFYVSCFRFAVLANAAFQEPHLFFRFEGHAIIIAITIISITISTMIIISIIISFPFRGPR